MSSSLSAQFSAFKRGEKTYEQIARIFYPICSRMVKATTYKYGIRDECAEDVTQEMLLQLPKLAVIYEESRSIEPLLYEIARRSAHAERNKKFRLFECSLAYDNDPNEWSANSNNVDEQDKLMSMALGEFDSSSEIESVEEKVDRASALEELSKKLYTDSHELLKSNIMNINTDTMNTQARSISSMPGVDLVSKKPLYEIPSVNTLPPPPAPPAKGKQVKKSKLTHDQQELVDIRNTLHMSQPDFAAALGINVPCLSAYEYGRTKKVPDHTMMAARELLAGGNKAVEDVIATYDGTPMSEIINRWADEMQVRQDDLHTLAVMLQTTETTIRRWRNNEARPKVQALVSYDIKVKNIQKRNERNRELQLSAVMLPAVEVE